MFYLYLLLISSVLYYFRYRIFWGCFAFFIKLWKWKLTIQNFYKKRVENSMVQVDTCVIEDEVFVEYNTICEQKSHRLIFIDTSHVVEFKKRQPDVLDNKRSIVFCGIMDSGGEVLYDTTDDIRKFCFYFDKSKSLGVFIKYLQYKLYKNNYSDDIIKLLQNGIFTVYMNDECFSEKNYPIKDLFFTDFRQVFLKDL